MKTIFINSFFKKAIHIFSIEAIKIHGENALSAFIKDKEFRVNLFTNIMFFGLLLFISSFFFAPDSSDLKSNFRSFFLIPFAIIIFTKKKVLYLLINKSSVLLLSYVVLLFLSVLWSSELNISKAIRDTVYFISLYAGILWLIKKNKLNINLICHAIMLSSLIIGPIICIKFYSANSLDLRLWPNDELLLGPKNPIHIATMYAISLSISFYYAIRSRVKYEALLYSVISICNLVVVLLTQSRGPIVALLCVFLISLFNKNIIQKIKIFAFIIITISSILLLYAYKNESIISSRIKSNGYRFEIWSSALSHTLENNVIVGEGRYDKRGILVELSKNPINSKRFSSRNA
jgi:hypothetical protein